ncbi:putative calcium-transporting ATPase [Helianthus annuus]|uniref:Calcium-transporting ATPase n=1 Tax=Helianthus annuus TaxID=4232 RepID=A0A9K3NUI3_HELAN|nr:putative calcium-transporting ATPase [Helianthus annuus]
MGVPDVNARKKIRGLRIMANYLIDNNRCCDWWTKRSKRVGIFELDRIRKSMSVIVREPDGHNRLLVKAIDLIDEAGSRVRLRHAQLPEEARELEKELRQITKEKNEAICGQDFGKV